MNPSTVQLISLALGALSYAFVILFIFNILKIDYFNPVVKFFVSAYKPISKLSIFSNQLYMIAIIAIGLKFLSFQLLYSSQYEAIILASIAGIETVNISLRVLFFAIIGSVILSWVAPNNNNPLLKIIEEISSKTLSPIRKFIPSFGGLDVTPIFAFILIRQVEVFLATIIRSIL
tara:strand:+ start:9264 stop:9788 length:525 start_codon:yes stop_codon:yes gene_type:complete